MYWMSFTVCLRLGNDAGLRVMYRGTALVNISMKPEVRGTCVIRLNECCQTDSMLSAMELRVLCDS